MYTHINSLDTHTQQNVQINWQNEKCTNVAAAAALSVVCACIFSVWVLEKCSALNKFHNDVRRFGVSLVFVFISIAILQQCTTAFTQLITHIKHTQRMCARIVATKRKWTVVEKTKRVRDKYSIQQVIQKHWDICWVCVCVFVFFHLIIISKCAMYSPHTLRIFGQFSRKLYIWVRNNHVYVW